MVGRKEQSIQFIRDSCPYPGRYLSSNSASGVDEYLNQYLNRCGIIPTEMHLYPDEEFSVIMTPLQGLLAENPNLAWGIIGRLGELRCHFPPEGKMRIVRMALEQEGVKIYSRPAVQDIAESAARQIVEFAPFPHREDFTALLSSFMHPEQDLARGLKTLSPNGFARHEECLLLALEKVREFYDSLGALVAKEHFPDNFLELVDSLRDLVKMLRRDNTSSLHLPMGLFLTIVDYIQEPDKLRNLQAYVNQATGKFLGDISEAAMILTVLEKEKIEGRVHLLGWHEVNNFVDKEETDKRFPGVVEALSKIKWIDSHVYQISFKGKEYVVIKV